MWGSQQIGLFPGAKYDGVFAVWYGKGPGVDRSGDALKHGNSAGTAPHGGVLALAGDDHTCKSSTLAHQSEFAFIDALIPVLNPAGVEDILDLGLYGWAMSRYSGCWVALKTVAETMDSSASITVDPARVEIVMPQDFAMPPGGLNIRWPDPPLDQEARLHRFKIPAAIAYARANRLDRIVIDRLTRASASSPPENPISTCGRRLKNSASTSRMLQRSAAALQGRDVLASGAGRRQALSPRVSRRCWSSRKSAPSSRSS